MSLARRLCAEAIGTALLLAIVVGSGIMGERLAGGNVAIALLANSLATGFGLFVLIALLAPISGAHFNPVVSIVSAIDKKISVGTCAAYIVTQIVAAVFGVWLAHTMFDLDIVQASTHHRTGSGQWLSEVVATAGLLLTIGGTAQRGVQTVAAAVGCYIAAAYWFTASTSFANPAVTIARAFTNTFAGIAPSDVSGFIVAQLLGAALAIILSRFLFSTDGERA
jgi:glycerol uptake facilitator-like aquaporin